MALFAVDVSAEIPYVSRYDVDTQEDGSYWTDKDGRPLDTWKDGDGNLRRLPVEKEGALLDSGEIPVSKNPTVFKLGILKSRDRAKIKDAAASAGVDMQIRAYSGTVENMWLSLGLRGWENFLDPANKREIKFEAVNGMLKESLLSQIHIRIREELATAIDKLNELGAEELKNCVPPSAST